MKTHRLKHSFTSGELSPLMEARKDFSRYNSGCKLLKNAVVHTQGPVSNRTGFKFIYNLSDLGISEFFTDAVGVKMIPFVFNENQSYVLIFIVRGTPTLTVSMLIADDNGLLVYPDPVPTECPPGTPLTGVSAGDIVTLDLGFQWDLTNMDYAQSGDELYIAMATRPPYVIKRHSLYCWTAEQIVFVDEPIEWVASNYPVSVTFHQQRLLFGGTPLQRQTIWCSKAGDFLDFGKNAPVLDSDAVTFTLDSGQQNQIHWLHSGRSLNAGTVANEWTVVGSTRAALTPSNILAQMQTSVGSVKLKPITSNSSVLFVGRYGRAVEEFVYNFDKDSYVTSNVSILSEHLTKHSSIREWTHQQSPDNIIWSVREDGILLGITYQRDHEVIAWHQHHTDGTVLNVASVPGNTREDELWAVVKRKITTGGVDSNIFCLEKKTPNFESGDLMDANFLDSSSVVDGTDITTINGLLHLEGVDVGILADGFVLPRQTVVAGSITLPNPHNHIVIGRPYETHITPNLADVPDQEGTGFGRVNRTSKVEVDFHETLGAELVRIDPDTGEEQQVVEILFRSPSDPVQSAVPLFSGIKHIDFPLGQSRNEQYAIKQTDPLPLTVRAIIDTVEYSS